MPTDITEFCERLRASADDREAFEQLFAAFLDRCEAVVVRMVLQEREEATLQTIFEVTDPERRMN